MYLHFQLMQRRVFEGIAPDTVYGLNYILEEASAVVRRIDNGSEVALVPNKRYPALSVAGPQRVKADTIAWVRIARTTEVSLALTEDERRDIFEDHEIVREFDGRQWTGGPWPPSDHVLSWTPQVGGTIFIGHGRSVVWRELKDYIKERLGYPTDEFESVPTAGVHTADRLTAMLDSAGFAFLVLTAEDESVKGQRRARQNVVHEVRLFQGRLGFDRAVLVIEDGCELFSNVAGLGHIRFPKGKIDACFHKVHEVLADRFPPP